MTDRAALLVVVLALAGPAAALAVEPAFEVPAAPELETAVRQGLRDALDLLEAAPDAAPAVDAPSVNVGVSRGIGLLDVARWGEGDFAGRGRALRAAAAEGKVDALLDLARFHLAHAMVEEGIVAIEAAIGAAGTAGTEEQRHRLRILRDAFAILDGSAVPGETVFVRRSPVDSTDHLLWRGAALADAGPAAWAEVRPALPEALRRLLAYPGHLRARLLARLAEGAAADDAGGLERIVVEMTTLDAGDRAPGLIDHYEGRVAELRGRLDAALARYDAAAASGGRFGRMAQLRAIGLRRREGLLDAAGALAALESLRYAWRGDEVEAAALAELGRAYLAVGRTDLALVALDLLGRRFAADAQGRAATASARVLARVLVDELARRAVPAELIYLSRRHDRLLARIDRDGGLRRGLAATLAGAGFAIEARRLLFVLVEDGETPVPAARLDLARLWLQADRPADALVLVGPADGDAGALLRAEAFLLLGRHIEALDALRGLDGREAARLRGRTLLAAGEWQAAHRSFAEALAGAAAPAPDDVARLALAALRAGDAAALREAALHRGVLDGTRWDGLLDALAAAPAGEDALRRELASAEALIAFGRRWSATGPSEP